MMELWPEPHEKLDISATYEADARHREDGSPWLVLSMISSLDGAASVEGVSGGLGGPADQEVFRALRGLADVIVVAAGTVRAEEYGPPQPSAETRNRRLDRGQAPAPRMILVSGSLSLDPDARIFTEDPPRGATDQRPVIFTVENADPERVAALSEVAEIRYAGRDRVSMTAAVAELGRDGAKVIMAEGGPSLNGQLLQEDLVDELCLSLSPTLVGGESQRIFRSSDETARTLTLNRVAMADGLLLLRYLRA